MMKQFLKRLLERLLPERIFTKIMSVRSRNYQKKFLREQGLVEMTEQMISHYGLSVLHGPLKGLVYPREAIVSRHGVPKLLGTYEMELHPVLSEVISRAESYDCLIDVGCAEGYYAVGLARKTGKVVYAFDTEPREQEFCAAMASLNRVGDRVIVKGWCDSKFLQSQEGRRCFIISDCEGYELKLFNPEAVVALSRSDLLIELHDLPGIDASTEIPNRFRGSHSVELISAEARSSEKLKELGFLGEDADRAICEYRNGDQKWVYLEAKSVATDRVNRGTLR